MNNETRILNNQIAIMQALKEILKILSENDKHNQQIMLARNHLTNCIRNTLNPGDKSRTVEQNKIGEEDEEVYTIGETE